MSEMNFPRQLLPVMVTITGGELVDRDYWRGRLLACLEYQSCMTQLHATLDDKRAFTLYPDANND